MILVMERGATEAQVGEVLAELERRGLRARRVDGGGKPLIHVLSGDTRKARRLLGHARVEALLPTSGPRVRREGRRFWPYHFIRWSALSIVLIGLLVLLAGQLPPGIGPGMDVQHQPAAIGQPWYVRAPLAFTALFPDGSTWLGWLCLLGLALVAFFLPVLDRSRTGSLRERWPIVAAGLLMVALWLWAALPGVDP